MKRIIFGLSLFLSTLDATCNIQPIYPGSGSAPKAYCWDISTILSEKYSSEENTSKKNTTTYDHGGSYIKVYVDVYGYGDSTEVDINYDKMSLVERIPITNIYKMVVGYRYIYLKNPNTFESGTVRVKNYGSVKDTLYFK